MNNELEKLAELRNQEGEVLYSLYLNLNHLVEPIGQINGKINRGDQSKQENPEGRSQNYHDQPMTDPQKRYIFRLLADKGIEGDAAYQHLKDAFGVNSLNLITKLDASRAIDRMLNE